MTTTKSDVAKSLWEIIDTFLILGAIAVTLALGFAYYYIEATSSVTIQPAVEEPKGDHRQTAPSANAGNIKTVDDATQPPNREKILKELSLAVIGNSIPVFLLFFLSALLFRRLNKVRKQDDQHSLATSLATKVVAALAKPSADQLFKRKTDEVELLDAAQIDALLIQETGSLVAESGRSEIIRLLDRGANVSIVVTAPIDSVARFMAFRNATLTLPTALIARASRFQDHLRGFQKAIRSGSGKLTVRYIPYPIGSTLTLVDASSDDLRKRRAVMRISGFKVPFENKLDIEFTGETSPDTFSQLHAEARQIYAHASKCILIHGPSRIGKTAFLRKLCEDIQAPQIYSILSEAIWDPNNSTQRLGFQVRTSLNATTPVQFASRLPDGNYDCTVAVWDGLADEIMQAANQGHIIILDEIGPLQLKSKKFHDAINQLFQNPSVHLFASLALPNVLGDAMHQTYWNHVRTTRYAIQSETDVTQLRPIIEGELTASIHTCAIAA